MSGISKECGRDPFKGTQVPDPSNVTSPITLVGYGRSGTSLIMHVLGDHPNVEICGETQSLIAGTWHAAERLKGIVRPDQTLADGADHRDRCAAAVRAAFLAMFPPNGRPRWMHKPIGIPWVFHTEKFSSLPFQDRCAWYWDVFGRCFPDAKVLTILRHPYDVVLSAERYWGTPHDRSWRGIVSMARLLDHADSRVDHAVSFAEMASDPEAEITRLLTFAELPDHAAPFAAAQAVYVPQMGQNRVPKARLTDLVGRRFSHRARWRDIDQATFTQDDRDIMSAMWQRFGFSLDL